VQADKIISDSHLDKEYSAIHGDAEFCKLVAQLAFGETSSIVKDGLVNMHCCHTYCCNLASTLMLVAGFRHPGTYPKNPPGFLGTPT